MHLQKRVHEVVTGAGGTRKKITVALGASAKDVEHSIAQPCTTASTNTSDSEDSSRTCNSASSHKTDDEENMKQK